MSRHALIAYRRGRSVRRGLDAMLLRIAIRIGLQVALSAAPLMAQQVRSGPQPFLVLDAGGHTAPVRKVLFTNSGRELITVADDKTIRLWDVTSGEPLRVLRPPIGNGAEGKLYAAALSPDGKLLAVAGNTSRSGFAVIYLIDLERGEMSRVLEGHTQAISGLDFAPSGRLLASCGADRTARIWELATGRSTQVLRGHRGPVHCISFAPDGRRCVTGSLDGTARIWSTGTGTQVALLSGHTQEVPSVAWNPDGRTIATGSGDETIRIWSPEGKLLQTYSASIAGIVGSLRYSRDGRWLLATHWDRRGEGGPIASLIDAAAGTQRVKFTAHSNTLFDAVLSPDGTLAASTGGNDSETYLWRTVDGSELHRLAARSRTVWSAGWDANRSQLAWGNTNAGNALELGPPLERSFDLNYLELAASITPEGAASWQRAQLQRGTSRLAPAGRTGVEIQQPGRQPVLLQPTDEYERAHDAVKCFSFLPDGRVAIGSAFGLRLYESATGKILRRFQGHTSEVLAVSPSRDGRFLVTASSDMTLRVWDPELEHPVLNLFFAGDDWIAWTHQGFYAASAGGERLMGWHVNNGTDRLAAFNPAAQFRKQFYRPDLIPLVLPAGGVDAALSILGEDSQMTIADNLPPQVEIQSPADSVSRVEGASVEVLVHARQTGRHPVTSLQVLIDGRPLSGPQSVYQLEPPAATGSHAFRVPLVAGVTHVIQARADSAASYALSKPIEVTSPGRAPPTLAQSTLPPTGNLPPTSAGGTLPPLSRPPDLIPTAEELAQRPALYVLAIGVAAYRAEGLSLSYADDDARKLAETLSRGGQQLFRKVELKLIVDADATQRGILQGLLWLKQQMTQHDIAVLFYSGHGDRDENGAFYLLPVDHEQETPLLISGVSDDAIKDVLGGTPGRIIVFLDACHAGVLGGDTRKSTRSVTDDIVRDLSTDDYGVIVMASAMGRELSLESAALQGGCFTLALTQGLEGAADANHDGYVYFTELDAFVSGRVKELTDGRQHPVTAKPATIRPFPVTRITPPGG